MHEVVKVQNYKDEKEKLDRKDFDIAILDIMGVDGFKLLVKYPMTL